ncbi:hypothetical protein CRUP_017108 [Coryphaenoides rupestris]|nr:hypothetical protein CRUP_017108 [Coryphaenoides rupestris]
MSTKRSGRQRYSVPCPFTYQHPRATTVRLKRRDFWPAPWWLRGWRWQRRGLQDDMCCKAAKHMEPQMKQSYRTSPNGQHGVRSLEVVFMEFSHKAVLSSLSLATGTASSPGTTGADGAPLLLLLLLLWCHFSPSHLSAVHRCAPMLPEEEGAAGVSQTVAQIHAGVGCYGHHVNRLAIFSSGLLVASDPSGRKEPVFLMSVFLMSVSFWYATSSSTCPDLGSREAFLKDRTSFCKEVTWSISFFFLATRSCSCSSLLTARKTRRPDPPDQTGAGSGAQRVGREAREERRGEEREGEERRGKERRGEERQGGEKEKESWGDRGGGDRPGRREAQLAGVESGSRDLIRLIIRRDVTDMTRAARVASVMRARTPGAKQAASARGVGPCAWPALPSTVVPLSPRAWVGC